MLLNDLLILLNHCEIDYILHTTDFNPDLDQVITKSGLIFSIAKPGSEFFGTGLVNVRTSV